jgi:HK97 family phage major capsid protein
VPKSARQLAEEIREKWNRAEVEGRDLTLTERREIQALIDSAESQHEIEKSMRSVGLGDLGPVSTDSRSVTGNPGAAFVKSAGYTRIADPASRGQSWSTGMVDVGPLQGKAGTALESGQGAGLVPVPQVAPGVVTKLFEPLGVADVFAQSQATTSTVRYINEGTATSGAAGVAEGSAKPASDLAYSTVDEPVRKIATSITTSDELLEDAANVEQFVNSRLSLFVKIEEERQLLRGSGSPELAGLVGRSGVNVYTKLAGDDNAVAIAKVIANTRGSSSLEPSAIIMHPTNWLATRLLRDGTGGTVGQFYGGGPITGAYGGGGNPGLFGQLLWNVPVVLSSVVGAGTAIVGSFNQGAEIWRRGGVSVEATNSHSDYFVKNLVALRAEQREALAVYRPGAFTVVSGLTS